MSISLKRFTANARDVSALPPDELGRLILEVLNSQASHAFVAPVLFEELTSEFGALGEEWQHLVESIGEAIQWLMVEGLLASRAFQDKTVIYVTRRGRQLKDSAAWAALRLSALLAWHALHPEISRRCRAKFLRGEYDSAAFEAFKAVEVEVRKAAGLADDVIGYDLMIQAFKPSKGVLVDPTELAAERQALMNLFTGAIGYCKNPHSHRDGPLTPEETSHLLVFASYLLWIVGARALSRQEPGR